MAKRDTPIRKALRQGELLFVPLSKEDYARLFGDEKDVTVMGASGTENSRAEYRASRGAGQG